MPVCLEVGVECTYPVAEATSAGLQWMAGYAVVFNLGRKCSRPRVIFINLLFIACRPF